MVETGTANPAPVNIMWFKPMNVYGTKISTRVQAEAFSHFLRMIEMHDLGDSAALEALIASRINQLGSIPARAADRLLQRAKKHGILKWSKYTRTWRPAKEFEEAKGNG